MTLKEALKLYEGQEGLKEIKTLIKKGINSRYFKKKNLKKDKKIMENAHLIHIAARFGYKEIVEALIENGADINIKGHFGYTALHEACRKNNIDIVNILIKNGADLNIKSGRYGFMPLYLVCEKITTRR